MATAAQASIWPQSMAQTFPQAHLPARHSPGIKHHDVVVQVWRQLHQARQDLQRGCRGHTGLGLTGGAGHAGTQDRRASKMTRGRRCGQRLVAEARRSRGPATAAQPPSNCRKALPPPPLAGSHPPCAAILLLCRRAWRTPACCAPGGGTWVPRCVAPRAASSFRCVPPLACSQRVPATNPSMNTAKHSCHHATDSCCLTSYHCPLQPAIQQLRSQHSKPGAERAHIRSSVSANS